ncbi:N-acetyltransferase 8 isoform X1 [Macrotis lagotis]|uniref:N-acetyltransferase 8 isoform X1 n=1 Tax=Macrotis lagotis TaxID=92651 RepID=UPI003D68A97C
MAPFQIRRYQDQDWSTVRAIFAKGMIQLAVVNFRHLLKQPGTFLLLLGGPGALYLFSGSSLLSLLALLGLLAILWLAARHPFSHYINHALHTDMWDIRASYVNDRGSCFWVAESGGQVVGLVCARPAQGMLVGPNYAELLRLSVRPEHRGQGIAKTLTQTVLQFAREKGYDGVILVTASLNYPARRLYESLGFWKFHEAPYSPKWSLKTFSLIYYRYDLPHSS